MSFDNRHLIRQKAPALTYKNWRLFLKRETAQEVWETSVLRRPGRSGEIRTFESHPTKTEKKGMSSTYGYAYFVQQLITLSAKSTAIFFDSSVSNFSTSSPTFFCTAAFPIYLTLKCSQNRLIPSSKGLIPYSRS